MSYQIIINKAYIKTERISQQRLRMCSKSDCKCSADISELSGRSKRFMNLVYKTLAEEGCPDIYQQNFRSSCPFLESEPTTVSLNAQNGAYLHGAETNARCYNCYSVQNDQLVAKLYTGPGGPCGVLLVFGARDDFGAASVTFACERNLAAMVCQPIASDPKN